jgi:predicted nucleic acid-binding protein
MSEGLLDTNVFVHAYANDSQTAECRGFLLALRDGRVRARLEPLVLHELSYSLPRYVKQMTRGQLANYFLAILEWDSIEGEKALMVDAVERWRDNPGLGFVDAYLAAIATTRRCPVFTKNVRDLVGQGAVVPEPLPS